LALEGGMNSLHFAVVVVVVSLLGATGRAISASPEESKTNRPPNIILILVDDMGWRDLGCYGSTFYQTPRIDQLAREGMKFTQAYSACSVCSPTRASLLTGQYPARLHLTDYLSGRPPKDAKLQIPQWTPYLKSGTATIASVLKSANYATAIIGKWHLGGSREFGAPAEAEKSIPENFGFDLNIGGSHYGQPPDYFFPYERKGAGGIVYRFPNLPGGRAGEYLTDRLTDETETFLEKNRERPFFLYLPHYAVHTSIGNRLQAKEQTIEKFKARVDPKSPQKNPVYAAMIEHLDDSIGRIAHKLKELKLDERTVVIFTSDNGGYNQMTAQQPLRGAKSEAYEGGIRVPLIVRWPGTVKPGSVSETPVTSPDFLPTCCEIANVKLDAKLTVDGKCVMPILRQAGKLDRDALYWHYPHYNDLTTPHGIVRKGDLKLIEYFEDGRLELFNLKSDVGEKENLARSQPEKADELHRLLVDWRKQVGAQMPTPKVNPK